MPYEKYTFPQTYGWVNVGGVTNEEYLASIPDTDPWKPAIVACHEDLVKIDPEYRISQIKEKFGGLRYYYDSSVLWDSPEGKRMMERTHQAEREVEALVIHRTANNEK
jgi:hypothetical protein